VPIVLSAVWGPAWSASVPRSFWLILAGANDAERSKALDALAEQGQSLKWGMHE